MVRKLLVPFCALVSHAVRMPKFSLEQSKATPTVHCSQPVLWNLCNGETHVENTNTLTRGSGGGGGEFRIKEIAESLGQKLDLLLTVPSTERYALKRAGEDNFAHVSPDPNFPKKEFTPGPPCWIVIPWKVETATTFNWQFVKTGTSTVFPLESFTLTVAELDQQKEDDHEYVQFETPYAELLSSGDLLDKFESGNLVKFQSKDLGVTEDNPSISGPLPAGCTPTAADPYSCLSDQQKRRSVSVEYTNRGEFELKLGHDSDTARQGDRFLEFYGTTCADPPPPCTPSVYWNLCNGENGVETTNTLTRGSGAGGGEFRIPGIATVGGNKLDLVLTVPATERYALKRAGEDNYAHVSPDSNFPKKEFTPGPPCWIVIPWKVETSTKFNWKFVQTGTNTPFPLERFTLTVAELDQQKEDDHEYVKFEPVYSKLISSGDLLDKFESDKLVKFQSKDLGVTEDNPSISGPLPAGCTPTAADPYSCLSAQQKSRSVTVEYEGTSGFEITLGHDSETARQGDRFLEFYGTTCA